jgi:hypothetical protein
MEFLILSPGLSFNESLVDSPGWFWSLPSKKQKGWQQPTRIWRLLTTSGLNHCQQWNVRWQAHWDIQQWKALWRQLWAGWGHPRTKFLLWRLIHFGFFTQAHGFLRKVCPALCPVCSAQDESILHHFFSVPGCVVGGSKYFLWCLLPHCNLDQFPLLWTSFKQRSNANTEVLQDYFCLQKCCGSLGKKGMLMSIKQTLLQHLS